MLVRFDVNVMAYVDLDIIRVVRVEDQIVIFDSFDLALENASVLHRNRIDGSCREGPRNQQCEENLTHSNHLESSVQLDLRVSTPELRVDHWNHMNRVVIPRMGAGRP